MPKKAQGRVKARRPEATALPSRRLNNFENAGARSPWPAIPDDKLDKHCRAPVKSLRQAIVAQRFARGNERRIHSFDLGADSRAPAQRQNAGGLAPRRWPGDCEAIKAVSPSKGADSYFQGDSP
jgi:hypothetical protein